MMHLLKGTFHDSLEKGLNTLPQIIDILLRFRLNKTTLTSDIKWKFLNVSMPEHGTIIRTGIAYKKIPCYMHDSA